MMNAKALACKDGISVVGILTKEAVLERKKKPILSFNERMELAHAIKYNDYVVAQEEYSPLRNIKDIRPDIVMESTSHKPEDIKEIRDYIELQCPMTRLVVSPYTPYHSSTSIKDKIKNQK